MAKCLIEEDSLEGSPGNAMTRRPPPLDPEEDGVPIDVELEGPRFVVSVELWSGRFLCHFTAARVRFNRRPDRNPILAGTASAFTGTAMAAGAWQVVPAWHVAILATAAVVVPVLTALTYLAARRKGR